MMSAPDSADPRVALEAVDAARAALVEEVGADVVGEAPRSAPSRRGAERTVW